MSLYAFLLFCLKLYLLLYIICFSDDDMFLCFLILFIFKLLNSLLLFLLLSLKLKDGKYLIPLIKVSIKGFEVMLLILFWFFILFKFKSLLTCELILPALAEIIFFCLFIFNIEFFSFSTWLEILSCSFIFLFEGKLSIFLYIKLLLLNFEPKILGSLFSFIKLILFLFWKLFFISFI